MSLYYSGGFYKFKDIDAFNNMCKYNNYKNKMNMSFILKRIGRITLTYQIIQNYYEDFKLF